MSYISDKPKTIRTFTKLREASVLYKYQLAEDKIRPWIEQSISTAAKTEVEEENKVTL